MNNLQELERKTREENNRTRDYKKLGYSGMETVLVVQPMSRLMANYQIHYQKLRNFHWNVRGGDFFDLHDKFEELYNEAQHNIDEIAERIRVFGQIPPSTLKEIIDLAEIEEVGTGLKPNDMVKEVLEDFQTLVDHMGEVIEAARETGDNSTVDLINTYMRNIEKHHWMFSAFLDQK